MNLGQRSDQAIFFFVCYSYLKANNDLSDTKNHSAFNYSSVFNHALTIEEKNTKAQLF